jgi:hypothetical protein
MESDMPYSDIEALDALEVAEAKVRELADQLAEATKGRDKARVATAPFAIGDEVEMLTRDAGWAPAEVTFIRLAYSTKFGPDWFFDYDVVIGPNRDSFHAVAEWDTTPFTLRNRIRAKRRKITEVSA